MPASPTLWKAVHELRITTKKSQRFYGSMDIQITDNWVFVKDGELVTSIPRDFIESVEWSEKPL